MPEELAEPAPFIEIQHPKKRRFLEAMSRVCNILRAADAAGIDPSSHYHWIKDPAYKAQFDIAKARGAEMLEAEMFRRIYDGIDEPVFHGGKRALDVELNPDGTVKFGANGKPIAIPAVVKKFSDTLMIFALKGAMPQKYRDNATIEHTGSGGAPLPANTEIVQVVMLAMQFAPPEHKAVLAAKLLELEPVHEPGA